MCLGCSTLGTPLSGGHLVLQPDQTCDMPTPAGSTCAMQLHLMYGFNLKCMLSVSMQGLLAIWLCILKADSVQIDISAAGGCPQISEILYDINNIASTCSLHLSSCNFACLCINGVFNGHRLPEAAGNGHCICPAHHSQSAS